LNEDQFWQLIQSAIPAEDEYSREEHFRRYEDAVSGLGDDDLIDFARIHRTLSLQAHGHPLWNAAYIINTGCGDDDFENFKAGLIARGREPFYNALRNPQSLADLSRVLELIKCEAFDYVATTVYDERHPEPGHEGQVSNFFPELYPNPRVLYGINYEEPEDLRREYPELFDRFWSLNGVDENTPDE
jgi:hypothetical protein